MDRVNQLRGGGTGTAQSPLLSTGDSLAYVSATSDSSKYFSLSEADSTLDITPPCISEVSLTTHLETPPEISELSPINKNDPLTNFKIGKAIEAANILSGGVDIFEDNENSYDGNELIIDDNVAADVENKIGQSDCYEKSVSSPASGHLDNAPEIASKETEVVLQIDGKNVDAIDIGNGLYLYRREGEKEELAAVQIVTEGEQPSFKFLKVRENAEGNLEVYEEIEVEVTRDVPSKVPKAVKSGISKIKEISKKPDDKQASESPVKTNDNTSSILPAETIAINVDPEGITPNKASNQVEPKKSPIMGSFTPMAYHSTPNKDGIPLTKTMVDQQLHPSRHSDNKKTIELNTESCKQKLLESSDKPSKIASEAHKDLPKEDGKDKGLKPIKNSGDTNSGASILSVASELKKNNILCDIVPDELKSESITLASPATIPADTTKNLEGSVTKKEYSEKKDILEDIENNKKSLDKKIKTVPNEINQWETDIPKTANEEALNEINKQLPTSSTPRPLENTNNSVDTKGNHGLPKSLFVEKEDVDSKNSQLQSSAKVPKIQESKEENNLNCTETKIKDMDKLVNANKTLFKNTSGEADLLSNESKIMFNIKSQNPLTKSEKSSVKNNPEAIKLNNPQNIASSGNKNFDTIKTFESDGSKKLLKVDALDSRAIQTKLEPSKISDKSDMFIDELIQLKDLGVEIAKDKPIDISEKGFPDCLKSVADILKPKSYSNKDSKIDQANQVKTPILPKTDLDIHKIKDSKAFLKSESLSSVYNKPKSSFMDCTKAVIIKSNVPADIQTSVFMKNETIVKDASSSTTSDKKTILFNNNSAVPFGKWTEANKQAYLNKIKEPKVISNPNQIKQAKDLNRRDILKKMDSQRQSFVNYSRSLEVLNKANLKKDTNAYNKLVVKQDPNPALSVEKPKDKSDEKQNSSKVSTKADAPIMQDNVNRSNVSVDASKNRQDFNNQDLIDRTIEDILMDRNCGVLEQNATKMSTTTTNQQNTSSVAERATNLPQSCSVEAVEKKMNELHGIPFVERPMNELPSRYNSDLITYSKSGKRPNTFLHKDRKKATLLPTRKPTDLILKETISLDDDSEDEVLEHEPVTGDMPYKNKSSAPSNVLKSQTISASGSNDKIDSLIAGKPLNNSAPHNSSKYNANIKYDSVTSKSNARNSIGSKDSSFTKYLVGSSGSQMPTVSSSSSLRTNASTYFQPIRSEDGIKTSPSKVQIAYTSALTAKRQKESPITVIEDKPVKVLFMDSGSGFVTAQLKAEGKELTSTKKYSSTDLFPMSSSDLNTNKIVETKRQDQKDLHPKHQRKQVLTPVEDQVSETISSSSHTANDATLNKKRKCDAFSNADKNVIPKKTYLLNRPAINEKLSQDTLISPTRTTLPHLSNAASAIDNLVKAAELLDNQVLNASNSVSDSSSPQPPKKRGRGRPRKHPLPATLSETLSASPIEKKPRTSKTKRVSTSDEDPETTDSEMVMENWTMGKINEKIVCPICGKLFRSENVVFKHVKHCTGPSPNRSDTSERRFSKRDRKRSGGSENSSLDTVDDKSSDINTKPCKNVLHKEEGKKESNVEKISNEAPLTELPNAKCNEIISSGGNEINVPIAQSEDAPTQKNNNDADLPIRELEKRKPVTKPDLKSNYGNMECGKCGKVFRQMSYFNKHKNECKLQQKREPSKFKQTQSTQQSVYSCEVCKKDFRKLHHLVQHRIIHNPTTSTRRKSSVEQLVKSSSNLKNIDAQSAGFRCEACDKSFRKLHHLVEHRETHDGLSRNKTVTTAQPSTEKADSPPQCDVCKKTFRKLHHMIEHKEQHNNPKPDKNDEKGGKGSLATKDIIHECPLCYMVFPNEHSLNKHSSNCQRKKRQSVSKSSAAPNAEGKLPKDSKSESSHPEKSETVSEDHQLLNKEISDEAVTQQSDKFSNKGPSKDIKTPAVNKADSTMDNKPIQQPPLESMLPIAKKKENKSDEYKNKVPKIIETILIEDTPVKKSVPKPSNAAIVTKRQKSTTPVPEKIDDDDDARYMLNPNYEEREAISSELFLSKASLKRNSLQIDRPAPKHDEALRRRTSLQHQPKIANNKPVTDYKNKRITKEKLLKPVKLDPISSDSEDSDIKYAFPESVPEVKESKAPALPERLPKRKSINEKRKSLTKLARRKTVGEANLKKNLLPKPPLKADIKRRTLHMIEHKCDCGQLFKSATLLTHHVSVSHTPPRRRRLSPPPLPPPTNKKGKQNTKITPAKTKPAPKPQSDQKTPKINPKKKIEPKNTNSETKSSTAAKSRIATVKNDIRASSRKSSARSEIEHSDVTPSKRAKSQSTTTPSIPKNQSSVSKSTRRKTGFHSGVPVPEKMRKLMAGKQL